MVGKLVVVAAAVAMCVPAVAAADRSAPTPWRVHEIVVVRDKVTECRADLYRAPIPHSAASPQGREYRKWVLSKWRDRLTDCKKAHTVMLDQVAARVDAGLRKVGSPMAGLGMVFAREGLRWDISPYLVAGVTGTEAGWGNTRCRGTFNAWGFGACGRAWSPPSFPSWAEAIAYATRYFHDKWGHANTPYEIGPGYAEGSKTWGPTTATHMAYAFGAAALVRYPV
jgi:hypothetical protein